jgi:hypothetical protein
MCWEISYGHGYFPYSRCGEVKRLDILGQIHLHTFLKAAYNDNIEKEGRAGFRNSSHSVTDLTGLTGSSTVLVFNW